MLTESEKKDIENWRHGLKDNILLQLSIKDDYAGSQIHKFCSELSDLVPEIVLKNEKEEDVQLSGIMVGMNISYHAVPISNELVPFLNALSSTPSLPEDVTAELKSILTGITTPAVLKIYMSPQCPFCTKVVTRCLSLARVNSAIKITVIDGYLFPEQAAEDNIRSVPTLILDDSFRWTGSIDLEELIKVIEQRDPMLLGIETFKSIIHEGRAKELSEMMADRGQVFPAFFELLLNKNWTVRLGAMAAFEYLAEESPDLCHMVNLELCKQFPDMEDQIQGDIIYLMGESGDGSVLPFLKRVLNGTYAPEVKDAAADAIDQLSCST